MRKLERQAKRSSMQTAKERSNKEEEQANARRNKNKKREMLGWDGGQRCKLSSGREPCRTDEQ
jgi:hypothetical protein